MSEPVQIVNYMRVSWGCVAIRHLVPHLVAAVRDARSAARARELARKIYCADDQGAREFFEGCASGLAVQLAFEALGFEERILNWLTYLSDAATQLGEDAEPLRRFAGVIGGPGLEPAEIEAAYLTARPSIEQLLDDVLLLHKISVSEPDAPQGAAWLARKCRDAWEELKLLRATIADATDRRPPGNASPSDQQADPEAAAVAQSFGPPLQTENPVVLDPRALEILRVMGESTSSQDLYELEAESGFSRKTVSKRLKTLARQGFVVIEHGNNHITAKGRNHLAGAKKKASPK